MIDLATILSRGVKNYVPRKHIAKLPDEPTVLQLATNFAAATAVWASHGFKIVTQAEYDARAKVCEGCEFWNGEARMGLGKCSAPGCGCTKFKRWLATEECPIEKW